MLMGEMRRGKKNRKAKGAKTKQMERKIHRKQRTGTELDIRK